MYLLNRTDLLSLLKFCLQNLFNDSVLVSIFVSFY